MGALDRRVPVRVVGDGDLPDPRLALAAGGVEHLPQLRLAMRSGVRRASRTLREVDWVEVVNIRGHVENGELAHFQVEMKIGFRLEDT